MNALHALRHKPSNFQYSPKNTRAEMAVWKRTPADYRSIINGVRYILHRNRQTGATELWPLSAAVAD